MEGIEEPLARIAGNAYVMDAAATLITAVTEHNAFTAGNIHRVDDRPLTAMGAVIFHNRRQHRLITAGIMQGEKPAVLSAIVKYHCTHRGQRAIIDARLRCSPLQR
jgi:acyl-CoA dehydrogenase